MSPLTIAAFSVERSSVIKKASSQASKHTMSGYIRTLEAGNSALGGLLRICQLEVRFTVNMSYDPR